MTEVKVTVTINRRAEIADPEGTTVKRSLHELGYTETASVRMDRVIHMDIDGNDVGEVRSRVEEMCRQVLANPVLEDFRIEVGR